MKLLVTGRNVDITPALRQLIERKLSRLDRVLSDSVVSAQVILRIEKYRHVADVTIHARGDHMLHGVGSALADLAMVQVYPAHPSLCSEGDEDRTERLDVPLTKAVFFLCQDYNASALRRFIRKRGQLGGIGQDFRDITPRSCFQLTRCRRRTDTDIQSGCLR